MNKLKRMAILVRDNHICQKCGVKVLSEEEVRRVPHVHHKDHDKKNEDPSNLETECAKCHTSGPKTMNSLQPQPFTVSGPSKDGRGYSLLEVSRELKVGYNTARRWLKGGYIKGNALPTGHYRISEAELNRVKGLLNGRQSNS